MRERLSKFISRSGVASRRRAEAIVRDGRVKVNNKTILEPFADIDPRLDHITVDNIPVTLSDKKKVYVALHKPEGYISDLADPKGRPMARDLIALEGRLYPVGRLDFASEGLMIFTNDGDFAQKVLHPSNAVAREYLVKIQRPFGPSEMQVLTEGRKFEGKLYRLHSVRLIKTTEKNAWYEMTAHEGRNRMIRKLTESLGHRVLRLRRVRIGPVALGGLKPGQYRSLSLAEVNELLRVKEDAARRQQNRSNP